MLHIRFIRENADLIRKNLERRRDVAKVRGLKKEIQDLRTQRNALSREVGQLKKQGKDDSKIVKRASAVNKRIAEVEQETASLEEELKGIQMRIPNILHESVPYGISDEDNEVVNMSKRIFSLILHDLHGSS